MRCVLSLTSWWRHRPGVAAFSFASELTWKRLTELGCPGLVVGLLVVVMNVLELVHCVVAMVATCVAVGLVDVLTGSAVSAIRVDLVLKGMDTLVSVGTSHVLGPLKVKVARH